MDKLLKGCGTALATPFKKDGAVDYEAYKTLVERQLNAGVDFLVPLGSTAETPCLSDEEKVELLRLTRELCPGKPVVAGAGSNSLAATLRTIKLLEPCGPDAYLIVVPFYNKPTQEGMFQYFKAVAEAAGKGVVVYNVPGRTGANMTAQTALRLSEIPGIIAFKEASGNLAQIQELLAGAPERISVLSGNDDQTWPLMACGADGVISVASNVAPELVAELARAALSGEMSKANELNKKLLRLYNACFVESNPIPVKAALKLLGLCESYMRLPLTQALEATAGEMEQTLRELALLA